MTNERLNELLRLEGRAFWEWFFDLDFSQLDTEQASAVYRQAEHRANHWNKCACCALHEERRHDAGFVYPVGTKRSQCAPMNAQLDAMGMDFYHRINAHDFSGARSLYAQIQQLVDEENALCTPKS